MSDELQAGPMVYQPPAPIVATTPLALIDKALSAGASIETLDKLMALQERWDKNEARKAYDAAIAKARAEIKPIIKNRTAGFESKRADARDKNVSYQYEDLAAIAEEVDPILAKYGLSYRYSSNVQGDQVFVTCIISHELGHREETTLPGPKDTSGSKNPIQAIGSTVTYLQRYTLKLAMGLAAAKDDDSKATDKIDPEKDKDITVEQFDELKSLLEQCNETEERLLGVLGLPLNKFMDHFTVGEYERAKDFMQNALRTRAKNQGADK